MTLSLDFAALTDVGRVRRNNEDSAYAGPYLLLLADGMGGAAAGEVASATAVEVLRKLDRPPAGDLIELLAGAVHRANERLSELVEQDPDIEGTGSTVTAILSDGERFALAHLGDSRAYRMRDGVLTQLSHDHTFVQSLVDEGRISQAEAQNHPHRNLILRVLDGRPDSDPDLHLVDIRAGDRLLLVSDGIPDYVRDDVIAQTMAGGTPDSVAVDLITIALEAGSNDNVTCVVADVVADGPALPPQLVGAAAELGQGGTGPEHTVALRKVGAGGAGGGASAAHDELEELRYAPQPPKRFRWVRRVALLAVVLALIAAGGRAAYGWTQQQYYVGTDGDNVAIYKGIDQAFPGIKLSDVYEVQTLQVDQLPRFRREQVEATINATDLQDARTIVAELRQLAEECAKEATPTPKPTPSVTPKPSTPPASKPPASKTTVKPSVRPTVRPSVKPSTASAIPTPEAGECGGDR
jgi:serine/threonine protein phosphatase PrpC